MLSRFNSETAVRLLLVAGTLFLALSLIELPAFIGVIDYGRFEVGGIWGNLSSRRIADPELVTLWPPHAHESGSTFGGRAETYYRIPASERTLFRWDIRIDQMGFRNATDLKSADTIVIGDSMVEGDSVPDDEVVTSLMQRLEGKTVANLGQLGYGPQQEMIVLKRYGLPLRPGAVVWVFSEGTDLGDFTFYIRRTLHPPSFWTSFWKRSFSRLAYHQARGLVAPRKPLGIEYSGAVQMPDGKAMRMYFDTWIHPLTGEEVRAIDGTARVLAEARRLSAAQGARFLVVFAPDKFRVYHDFCRYPPESKCSRWTPTDLPERLSRAMEAVSPGIGYLDLTADLAAAVKGGSMPYYSDDVHWSPEGHKVAARAIDAYLASHP